jgi:hypothetical protein
MLDQPRKAQQGIAKAMPIDLSKWKYSHLKCFSTKGVALSALCVWRRKRKRLKRRQKWQKTSHTRISSLSFSPPNDFIQ